MKCLLLIPATFLLLSACQPTPESAANDRGQDPPPAAQASASEMTLDSAFTLAYIMGQFDPTTHPDFIEIPTEWADRPGRWIRKDTWEAFLQMATHAQQDGISLRIVSAARNFANQKRIWEAKWNGTRLVDGGVNLAEAVPDPVERARRILRWSSMPGTSRHHWGTDIDLNHLENDWFASGSGLALYQWMKAHAADYGFGQPYTRKGAHRSTGYEEEKWHWSYLPVARPLTSLAAAQLRDSMITGFAGSAVADSLQVVEHYILGIDPTCR